MRPNPLPVLALALALALHAMPAPAHADDSGAVTAEDGRTPPLWEAGLAAFGAHGPAYPGAAQRTRNGLVVPYLLYRGRVLRADRDTVGVRAARTERLELDVGFAGSFGSAASDTDARRGMPAIGTLVEFGPRLRWRIGPAFGGRLVATVPLRGVFDLGDGFRHRGLALEPALGWSTRAAGFNLGSSAGLLIADQRLAHTFYGVAPAFATPARPAHEAQAGLVATRLSFSASRPLARDWVVFGFVRVDSVRRAANRASPLVDAPGGTAVGLGVSWTFARSDRPAER